MVYSDDIKGDVEVIYKKMPITLLEKGQELELIGFVRLGKGIEHAKFSPGLVYYRHISKITVKNAEKARGFIDKIKKSISTSVKSNIKSGDVLLSKEDADYLETLNHDGAVEIGLGEEIIFNIESWGQINAEEIFNQAVKSLDKNLKEVLKAVNK